MRKASAAALIAFAMLWQTALALFPGSAAVAQAQISHMLVHAQALDHHHVPEESVCLDGSEEQRTHVHEDVQPALLLPAKCDRSRVSPTAPPTGTLGEAKPSVVSEGVLRPPSA